tara:strand:+ start:822 stop:965 length:144 start_codon:yes stop_codon:yes gene_type:complete
MPHPFYMRRPEKKSPKAVNRKSESVGKQIKQIFINIRDILKILVKWR